MDRMCFMSKWSFTDADDLKNYLLEYFDETMALYDLVGHCTDILITPEVSGVSFTVRLSSNESAIKLYESLARVEVSMYNHVYKVESSLNGDTIFLELKDIRVYA